MTRKDYAMVANRIKVEMALWRSGQASRSAIALLALENLAFALSDDFGRDNPNFKPERFLSACGERRLRVSSPRHPWTTHSSN